jgi:hypothetical protein
MGGPAGGRTYVEAWGLGPDGAAGGVADDGVVEVARADEAGIDIRLIRSLDRLLSSMRNAHLART